MDNYKLTIPKPCQENWEGMTPDARGRFCSLCEKTVVDFTGMPGTEISNYLMASAGKKVCGRFTQNQLQPEMFVPKIPYSILMSQTSFRKIFMLALFITMGTTLFSCKSYNDDRMILGEPAFVDDTQTHIDSVTQKFKTEGLTREELDSAILVGDFLFHDTIKNK